MNYDEKCEDWLKSNSELPAANISDAVEPHNPSPINKPGIVPSLSLSMTSCKLYFTE